MLDRFEVFAGTVHELNRYIQKIKELEMGKLGLKAGHTMCLFYLGQYEEGLTSTQLTNLCKEDKAAISRSLKELVQRGLVISHQSESGRSYRTPYFLTEDGKELVQKINGRVENVLFYGGNGLNEAQRKDFYNAMELIRSNLENYLSDQRKEQ